MSEDDVVRLTELADQLCRPWRPWMDPALEFKDRAYIAAWLRFAAGELTKPRAEPARAAHRPKDWKVIDALLMFAWKVVHEGKTRSEACDEIAESFGLQDSRSISRNAEFMARRDEFVADFKRSRQQSVRKKVVRTTG